MGGLNMKKDIRLSISIGAMLCILMLTSCGSQTAQGTVANTASTVLETAGVDETVSSAQTNSTISDTSAEESVEEEKKPLYLEFENASGLSEDELASAICNRQNDSRYTEDNGWIYGLGNVNDTSALVKARVDGTDVTVLRENCEPYNVTIYDGYVYSIIIDYQYGDQGDGGFNLFRCKESGTGAKTIIKKVGNFQIANGKIYYIDRNSSVPALYRCDLDGTNKEAIINKDINSFYVAGDYIACTENINNGRNGIHIVIYNMNNGVSESITDKITSNWTLHGNMLIYSGADANKSNIDDIDDKYYNIYAKNLSTGEENIIASAQPFFNIIGETIYYVDESDDDRIWSVDIDGSNRHLIAQEKYIYNDIDTIGNSLVCYRFKDKSEYVMNSAILCDIDGTNQINLFKFLDADN